MSSLRWRDHIAREQSEITTTHQIQQLETAQMNQSQTLCLVAERVEAVLKQLSPNVEASQIHMRHLSPNVEASQLRVGKCTDQIASVRERQMDLEKEWRMPDPRKKPGRRRDIPIKQEEAESHSSRQSSYRRCYIADTEIPHTICHIQYNMSYPSSGSTDPNQNAHADTYRALPVPGKSPIIDTRPKGQPLLFAGGSTRNSNMNKICGPPNFDPYNLDRWMREMHFWRGMYQMIHDDQIIAAAGIQGNPELREVVMDYIEECRTQSDLPTILSRLGRIGREYGALTEVQ